MAQRRGAPPAPAGRRRGRPGPAPPPAPPAGAGGRDRGGMQRPVSFALCGGAAFGPGQCGDGPPACAWPCPPRRSRGVRGTGCGSRRREGRRRRGGCVPPGGGAAACPGPGESLERRELPAVAAVPQRRGSRGVRWACGRQRGGVRTWVKCAPRTTAVLLSAATSPKHQQTFPFLTLFPVLSAKLLNCPYAQDGFVYIVTSRKVCFALRCSFSLPSGK